MKHTYLKTFIIAVLCTVFSVVTLSAQSAPKVGDKAPDFTIKLETGETVKLSSYKGKAVLLNFWATWCPPCRAELPYFDALAQRLASNKQSKLVYLGICVGDTEKNRSSFMKKNGYTFPGGLDTLDTIGLSYGITGIPTTMLISPEGIIEAIQIGAMSKAKLAQFISQYEK